MHLLLLEALLGCRSADPPSSGAAEAVPSLVALDSREGAIAPAGAHASPDPEPDCATPAGEPHAATLGADPVPEHVRLGWPSSDPSRSVSFVWGTDADTLATVVEYGADGQLTQRVEGTSRRVGREEGNPGPDRLHEVAICGALEPETTYTYRVGGHGGWSKPYTFTTPPAPSAKGPLRIAVAGDSRGGMDVWSQLVAAIEAQDPDLVLFAGDMVHDGDLIEQWDEWFTATGELVARRMLVPAHGNHEKLAAEYFEQFALAGNEQWFTYRVGDLQLVVLNDTVAADEEITRIQPRFLDRVLGASDAGWRIVLHHRTIWATSAYHSAPEDLREAWVPRFEANDVDVVIAAHAHAYERSVPIRGGVAVPMGKGPTYLTSGGAGADLYNDFDPDWFGAVALATEHYVLLDLDATELRGTVRDLAGNTIDSFVIPR